MSKTDHRNLLIMLTVSAGILGLFLCVACAKAADLPHGLTCIDVQRVAQDHNISNTAWGRAKARVIAMAHGFRFTTAQLDAAARCLRNKT